MGRDADEARRAELAADLDLLLDGEAGEGEARLLAEVARDPELKAELEARRALEVALRASVAEVEPPAEMWSRFAPRLEDEPVPAPGLVSWVASLIEPLVPRAPVRTAMAGACVFLLAYRALWVGEVGGGVGFAPMQDHHLRWSLADHAFQETMTDVYHEETADLFEATLGAEEFRWQLMDDAFDDFERGLETSADG